MNLDSDPDLDLDLDLGSDLDLDLEIGFGLGLELGGFMNRALDVLMSVGVGLIVVLLWVALVNG